MTIEPLPTTDHDTLTTLYHAQYPRVCSDLDEYGHPVQWTGSGPTCISQTSAGIDIDAPRDALIEAAKATMADMFEFTGVADQTALLADRINVFRGSPFTKSYLIVTFENQRYEGREVLFTPLTAWVDSVGVFQVRGYHFAEIHLPAIRHPAFVAQASIVGLEIPWRDVMGREHIFVVTRDSFNDEPVQVVYPRRVADTIELRVAWQIGVGSAEVGDWYVYVDIVTGDLLGTRQLFAT
jgi:hypothetical protein